MKTLNIGLLAAFAYAMVPAASLASDRCYEMQTVPPKYECGDNVRLQGSADFVVQCGWTDAGQVEVEVECPSSQWVPAIQGTFTNPVRHFYIYAYAPINEQAFHCAFYGMKPTTINGQVCASAMHRPQSGWGWDKILYPVPGVGAPTSVGGNYLQNLGVSNAISYCAIHDPASGPYKVLSILPYVQPTAIACERCTPHPCPRPNFVITKDGYGWSPTPQIVDPDPDFYFGPVRNPQNWGLTWSGAGIEDRFRGLPGYVHIPSPAAP